jgi:hypothetical protein
MHPAHSFQLGQLPLQGRDAAARKECRRLRINTECMPGSTMDTAGGRKPPRPLSAAEAATVRLAGLEPTPSTASVLGEAAGSRADLVGASCPVAL